MKLQSRPPAAAKDTISIYQLPAFLQVVLEMEGGGESRTYKIVLLKGALQILQQQEIIRQYLVGTDYTGPAGIKVTIEDHDYKMERFYL